MDIFINDFDFCCRMSEQKTQDLKTMEKWSPSQAGLLKWGEEGSDSRPDESPINLVKLIVFFMDAHEVTNKQF